MDKSSKANRSVASASLTTKTEIEEKGYMLLSSERGVTLVVVMVLSAVCLALITALLYLVTAGTQTSGIHKRYRSALEAGYAGTDMIFQIIDQRGDNGAIDSLLNGWQTGGLNVLNNVSNTCSGSLVSGSTATGAAAKNMASGSNWTASCGNITDLSSDSGSFDYKFQLGVNPKYTVYARIVDVREGNTSAIGGAGRKAKRLTLSPVVGGGSGSGGSGEILTASTPYLYVIEVDAENSAKPDEHAKLSVLYQY